MGVEYEYFGNKIVHYGLGDWRGFVHNAKGEVVELRDDSESGIKEKIDDYLRKKEKDELYDRIDNHTDCSRAAFDFFYNMIVSFHSCEGAALIRMQDYCNAKNI